MQNVDRALALRSAMWAAEADAMELRAPIGRRGARVEDESSRVFDLLGENRFSSSVSIEWA